MNPDVNMGLTAIDIDACMDFQGTNSRSNGSFKRVGYREYGQICASTIPSIMVSIGDHLLEAEIFVLDMHDFDIILGIDWLD